MPSEEDDAHTVRIWREKTYEVPDFDEERLIDAGVTGGGGENGAEPERSRASRTRTVTMTAVPGREERQASGSAVYRRRKTHARALAVTETGISNYVIEKAQQRGLVLAMEDTDYEMDEIERARQVKIIRGMALPLANKRKLRQVIFDEMSSGHSKGRTPFLAEAKVNCYRWWAKTKSQLNELQDAVSIWRGALKTIEGMFGGGVLTYFCFLKWLFLLNVYVFIIVFIFIAVPQMAFPSVGYSMTNTSSMSANTLRAGVCSQLYVVVTPAGATAAQPVVDFLQGTGWMEKTVVFYGAYSDQRVYISSASFNYNLPLAFILAVLAYFLLSLVLVVRETAQGVRDKMLTLEQSQAQTGYQMFVWWDFGLSDDKNASIRHNNIYREIKCNLEELRRAAECRHRSRKETALLWTKRVAIHFTVLVFLGGAGYLIYYTTVKSIEITNQSTYSTLSAIEQLLVQYMTSVTITALNAAIPTVFKKLAEWEGISYAQEVNYTLARTAVLKLASLAVLLFSVYSQIDCSPKDNCNVGTGTCTAMRCWETLIGQEFYKLVLMDFIVAIAVVFFVEFPRRIFVTKVNWKIAKTIGLQEFDIPKNILDLIYSQVLVWFGTFFSPMIPAMTVVKLFMIFYARMVSLLYNFTPCSKPYRASDTNFFVLIVLMVAYTVCAVPIMYVIWRMAPSTGCGPFRTYNYMYEIMNVTIAGWPGWMQGLVGFISSASFGIPCFVVLVLIIYYVRKMMYTYKHMNRILKEQLLMEGHDKKFLVQRLQEISGQSDDPVSTKKHGLGTEYGGEGDVTGGLPPVS